MNRSRRRFLRLSALAIPARYAEFQAGRAPGSDTPIVVIGAGLAGLRAAELIRAAGRPVVVLEASPRAGGRVRTIRQPFADGLHAEAGPLRIVGAHEAVRRAVRAHGLTLVPFESAQGSPVSVLGGKRVSDVGGNRRDWLLDLKPGEASLNQRELLEHYVGELPQGLSDPNVPLASYGRWREYDRLSWPEWLRARGASDDAVKVMTLGGDSSEVSALYILRQFAMLGDSTQRYKIGGGMDRLPAAMAAGLGDIVHYNAAVVRIARQASGFRVDYEQQGRLQNVVASRLVCTLPLPTLQRIERQPRWSAAKEAMIAQTAYYPVVRTLLQAKTRFWQRDGFNGSGRTDRSTEIWDATHDQLMRTRGILGASIGGATARTAVPLGSEQAVAFGVDLVADGFPAIRAELERGVALRWDLDPWARGAFVAGRPGQLTTLLTDAAAPEDGIHFAGEHTSSWMGWMEGALLSGERVAREVIEGA